MESNSIYHLSPPFHSTGGETSSSSNHFICFHSFSFDFNRFQSFHSFLSFSIISLNFIRFIAVIVVIALRWLERSFSPDVKLEPPLSDDAAEDGAGVDADAHVDRLVPVFVELSDGRNHGQAHLDAVLGVVRLRLGAAFIKRGHIQLNFSWLQIEMIFPHSSHLSLRSPDGAARITCYNFSYQLIRHSGIQTHASQ